jgi:hypothetical protein
MDGKPAVIAANRETASVAGDQHVRAQRGRGPDPSAASAAHFLNGARAAGPGIKAKKARTMKKITPATTAM